MAHSKDMGFSIPGLNWDTYAKFRPTYPASLYSRIYEYHKQHCDRWAVAHDAGSGAGIVAGVLAERFDTVAVSDPNGVYLDVARNRLERLESSAKFVFHQSTAEDQSWLDANSLDMFTMFTAIGFADLDMLMQELSKVLRPGATFVAVNYNGWPALVNNEAAASAWMDYADVWLTRGLEKGGESTKRGFRTTWAGHDSIALPGDIFNEGALRIKINEKFRPEADQVKRIPELGFPTSKVQDTDVVVDEEDIDQWTRDYTFQELKSFVGTLADKPGDADVKRLWDRVEQAMQQSGQTTLRLVWTVHITLATRQQS